MASDFLARIKQSSVLCDGAMGTLLYAKGIFINRSYDELNLSQPDLIRGIHHEYLQAGAEIIETNTFGGLTGKPCSGQIDVADFVSQAVPSQTESVATESIGFNDFGAGLEVVVVDSAN